MDKRQMADRILIAAAALLTALGVAALAIVVIAGLTGARVATPLTFMGLWFPIAGFALILVQCFRMILRKRAS